MDRIANKEIAEMLARLEDRNRYREMIYEPFHEMFIPLVHYYERFMVKNVAGEVATLFMDDIRQGWLQ